MEKKTLFVIVALSALAAVVLFIGANYFVKSNILNSINVSDLKEPVVISSPYSLFSSPKSQLSAQAINLQSRIRSDQNKDPFSIALMDENEPMEVTVDLIVLLGRMAIVKSYASESQDFHANYLKVQQNSSNFSDGSISVNEFLERNRGLTVESVLKESQQNQNIPDSIIPSFKIGSGYESLATTSANRVVLPVSKQLESLSIKLRDLGSVLPKDAINLVSATPANDEEKAFQIEVLRQAKTKLEKYAQYQID